MSEELFDSLDSSKSEDIKMCINNFAFMEDFGTYPSLNSEGRIGKQKQQRYNTLPTNMFSEAEDRKQKVRKSFRNSRIFIPTAGGHQEAISEESEEELSATFEIFDHSSGCSRTSSFDKVRPSGFDKVRPSGFDKVRPSVPAKPSTLRSSHSADNIDITVVDSLNSSPNSLKSMTPTKQDLLQQLANIKIENSTNNAEEVTLDMFHHDIMKNKPELESDDESDDEACGIQNLDMPLDDVYTETLRDIQTKEIVKGEFLSRKVNAEYGIKNNLFLNSWKTSWVELRGECLVIYHSDPAIPDIKNVYSSRKKQSNQLVLRTGNVLKTVLNKFMDLRSKQSVASKSVLKRKDDSNERNGPSATSPAPSTSSSLMQTRSRSNSIAVNAKKGLKVLYKRRPVKYVMQLAGCLLTNLYKVSSQKLYCFKILTSRNFEIMFNCESLDSLSEWTSLISDAIEVANARATDASEPRRMTKKLTRRPIVPQKDKDLRKISYNQISPLVNEHSKGNKTVMFGMELQTYCDCTGRTVPKFLKRMIREIENKGLTTQGIYRISGSSTTVDFVKSKVEENENIEIEGKLYDHDVHVLASLVKRFFRDMKESLLTDRGYAEYIRIEQQEVNQTAQLSKYRELIYELPQPNFNTLKVLLLHLYRVQSFSSENKMNSTNLALLFGPAILRRNGDGVEYFLKIKAITNIVECLIDNVSYLYGKE
jgi:hypothetical protein